MEATSLASATKEESPLACDHHESPVSYHLGSGDRLYYRLRLEFLTHAHLVAT